MKATPVLQLGHSEYILRMEFTQDGRRLATLDDAGILKLWDVDQGRLLMNLLESGRTAADAEEFFNFTRDGSLLFVNDPFAGTVFYDAISGQRLLQTSTPELTCATVLEDAILCPVLSPGGIALLDAASGEQCQWLPWPRRGYSSRGGPDISPDGSIVGAPSSRNSIVFWDTGSGEVLNEWPVPTAHANIDTLFARDGVWLAFSSPWDPVRLLNRQTGELSAVFGGAGVAERFWIDPAVERLAAYQGWNIAVWDLATRALILETEEESYPEEAAVSFRTDGRILAAWSDGNEIYVDELTEKVRLWEAPPPPACPFGYSLCFDPAGTLLIRTSAELSEEEHSLQSYLSAWSVQDLQRRYALPLEEDSILRLEATPDGAGFICADAGRLASRHWHTGAIIAEWDINLTDAIDFALSPDGERLLITGMNSKPYSIHLTTGNEDPVFRFSLFDSFLIGLAQFGKVNPFEEFAQVNPALPLSAVHLHLLFVSAKNNLLITSSKDAGLSLWNLASGQCIHRYPLRGQRCTALAASPDGRWLAAAIQQRIEIFELPSLRYTDTLSGHTNSIAALHFRSDSRVLASGSSDSTVRLWSFETGEEMQTLRGHCGPVRAVQFVWPGTLLASAANDATFMLWDTHTGELISTVLDPTPTAAVVLGPEGTYHADPEAAHLLSFTIQDESGLRNLSLEEYETEFGTQT